jgi:hypothetical protein
MPRSSASILGANASRTREDGMPVWIITSKPLGAAPRQYKAASGPVPSRQVDEWN